MPYKKSSDFNCTKCGEITMRLSSSGGVGLFEGWRLGVEGGIGRCLGDSFASRGEYFVVVQVVSIWELDGRPRRAFLKKSVLIPFFDLLRAT